MDVSASFLIAKNVDEAFDARFKAGGSGLRIDRKVQDGLALNAADDGVVGHRIRAAGKRADKQDAVNRAMQLHNRADDLTIHDSRSREACRRIRSFSAELACACKASFQARFV